MSEASVPYALLRTLRACLDGTADQPAWDRAKDELDDLLLAEPGESPVLTAAAAMRELERLATYPRVEFDERSGLWVRWQEPGIGRVVGPPDEPWPVDD